DRRRRLIPSWMISITSFMRSSSAGTIPSSSSPTKRVLEMLPPSRSARTAMPTTMYSKSSSPSKAALTTCLMSCLLMGFLRKEQDVVGDVGGHAGDGEHGEPERGGVKLLGLDLIRERGDAVLAGDAVPRDNEGEVVRGVGVGQHLGHVD